jgi:8-oxo-dGTP pyrophosphatase MutT (NUDIX family)
MSQTEITRLSAIDTRYEPVEWEFSTQQRAEIDTHWAKLLLDKPKMFNGTVLMQHRWRLQDGVYTAGYSPVDYASFLSWHHFGFPGSPRRNGFAMAALRANDGAFILGVMGDHTANAGKIYFPGGTPDMSDVTTDNRVDLATSMTRELFEETGLNATEITIDEQWVLVTSAQRAAFMKNTRLKVNAKTAREMILDRLATQTDQELSDIAIVRAPEDINLEKTPAFAADFMRSIFAEEAMS